MADLIEWQTFPGNKLRSIDLSDSALRNLYGLFLDSRNAGCEVDEEGFLNRLAYGTVLLGSDVRQVTALGIYDYQPYSKHSYVEVDTLAVREAYRRQGFGSFALRRIIGEARSLECDYVRLSSRKSAVSFYQAHGFSHEPGIKTRSDYVHMRLDLSRAALSEETTLRTPLKSV